MIGKTFDRPGLRLVVNALIGFSISACVIAASACFADSPQNSGNDDFAHSFLETYCMRCHVGEDSDSGVDLTPLKQPESILTRLDLWQDAVTAIHDQFMPPAEELAPSDEEVAELKQWFSASVHENHAVADPIAHMRRLNQIEYENTLGDLLKIDGQIFSNSSRILVYDDYFDPAVRKMPRHVLAMSHFSYGQKRKPLLPGIPDVPADPPIEHGFNNEHSSLSLSPLQTERYFELTNTILNSDRLPRVSRIWKDLFAAPPDKTDSHQIESAKIRLAPFLERAFRRPVTEEELARYVSLFAKKYTESHSYLQAMKTTVSAVLVSPSFLFRQDFSAESFDEEAVHPYAMANRLSYFLWSSMPDDPLFQAAKEGRLADRDDLIREVRRMMADRRVKSLATDFGMQWLKVSKVNSARPDQKLFPEYYYAQAYTPGVSMMIEQLLLFETIMIEDRNILEFIDADWAYLNRNLMDWYELDPEKVLGFTPDREMWEDYFRISWGDDPNRGGIVSSGATLLSTSATTRTSPVFRGAWILDVVLNRPPPAPPAAVPALEDVKDVSDQPLNVRQRLERHREDPTCAVCHDRIDPLGFALENFDAVGRFRNDYPNGIRIDAEGSIFGEPFTNVGEFKAILKRNERAFVQGFTEHMLEYALGRRLELVDEAQIQSIVDKVMARGKTFSAVVEEIVASDLFRSPPSVLTAAKPVQKEMPPEPDPELGKKLSKPLSSLESSSNHR